MRALDRKLLRDMRSLGVQAVAISLVLASGIAMFVLSRTTLDSLQLTQETYYRESAFADVFASAKRAPEAVAAQLAELPGVAIAETRVVAGVTLDIEGLEEPATGRLVSIPESGQPRLNRLHLRQGRLPHPDRPDEVVISEAFASAQGMQAGDSLRAVIHGRQRRLEVVGVGLSPEHVFSIRPGSFFPDDRHFGVMWMARPALAAAFDLDGAFNDVVIRLAPGASEAAVLAGVDRVLEPHGGLGAFGRRDQISHFYLSDEIEQLRTMGWIAPSIFLLVAAFLVNMVLARLTSTQREQIALLKAFGYSDAAVAWHYVQLVLVVVALASILGIAAGAWLGAQNTEVYARFYRFPVLRYAANPALVAGGVAVGAVAALLGALVSVRRAVRLPPAEAMRPPAPASFRPTIVEKAGLQRAFSVSTRMVLRQLERRPWRALFSIVGIAMAVAILVLGPSVIDAFDRIIAVQFEVADRQDITVTLSEPGSPRVTHALARLPGVLEVEPYREVAVRLRAGHRSKLVGLRGLPADGRLRRIVNPEGGVIPVPPEGLLLSRRLGELLGVDVGDSVRVEVLERERPVRDATVVVLADDFIGLTAAMELDALRRLLREDRTVTGAALRTDASMRAELHSILKRTPVVASVNLQESIIRSFRETIAEGMTRMAIYNVIFASIIAFGVVYNSARIALAERARELASLRVLGFTRGEVSVMLLMEIALLTLAAIPVGWVLGWLLNLLMAAAMATDLYRFPVVAETATYAQAALVVLAASLLSALVVRRGIDRLDLVAVLKTPE